MKLKVYGNRAHRLLGWLSKAFPEEDWDLALPLEIEVSGAVEEYTRQEEKGFHWLLNRWLERDKRIENFDQEDLKEWICAKVWGEIRKVDPDGQSLYLASRRTTRVFDHDKGGYVKKPLSVEGYAFLIDETYRLATEHGITLPEMEK